MPMHSARQARIRSMCGFSLGRSAHTVASTLPHRVAVVGQQGNGPAQQHLAVDVFELGARVGEVVADVAQGGGAEQRVADGVDEDVGVAVAEQSRFVFQADAAEPQGAARHEPVHVESEAYSDVHGRCF